MAESAFPDTCEHCGRSPLTHLMQGEVWGKGYVHQEPYASMPREEFYCCSCSLTAVVRPTVPTFEQWFQAALKRFQEMREVAPPTTPSGFVPRNREEFEAVFRERMRFARLRAGFTQAQIAEQLGITRLTYNHFENGTRWKTGPYAGNLRAHMGIYDLHRASRMLGCSMDWLCGITDDPGWFEPDLSPLLGFEEYLRRETRAKNPGKRTVAQRATVEGGP